MQLKITIGAASVNDEYKQVKNRYKKKAAVKGFRPGKAPLSMIEAQYAQDILKDVIENLTSAGVHEVFKAHEDIPRPLEDVRLEKPETVVCAPDSDFSFQVHYDVAPVVELKKYTELEVETSYAKVQDQDIDDYLKVLQGQHAVIQKKEGKVKEGDVVLFDLWAVDEAGEPLTQNVQKDTMCVVGEEKFAPELENIFVGMAIDEERLVTIQPPQETGKGKSGKKGAKKNGDTKEKSAEDAHPNSAVPQRYKVHVTAVKERILPPIDDDFAKEVGEKFSDMKTLQGHVRKRLAEGVEVQKKAHDINQVFLKILSTSKVEVPALFIKKYVLSRLEELRVRYNLKDLAEVLDLIEKNHPDENKFMEQLSSEGHYMIAIDIIKQAIYEKEKLGDMKDINTPEGQHSIQNFLLAHNKFVDTEKRAVKDFLDRNEYNSLIYHE